MPHGTARLVRLSPELDEAARKRIRRLGWTFARYIRDLIARDTGLDPETAKAARGVGSEPESSG